MLSNVVCRLTVPPTSVHTNTADTGTVVSPRGGGGGGGEVEESGMVVQLDQCTTSHKTAQCCCTPRNEHAQYSVSRLVPIGSNVETVGVRQKASHSVTNRYGRNGGDCFDLSSPYPMLYKTDERSTIGETGWRGSVLV